MNITNLTNQNRIITQQKGMFYTLEYERDLSVAPWEIQTQFFMAQMGVRKRQLLAQMDGSRGLILQAGEMQWTGGEIEPTTGIKGAGDLLGKIGKGMVTKESAIKPEYYGRGYLMTEPTYKHIILIDMAQWPNGMTIEDGLFLAAESTVQLSVQSRRSMSSAVFGKEGLFNTALYGSGVVALESNVPEVELIDVELNGETLKIDGNLAVAWSSSLQFTVEASSKSLLGSAVNKEGLVNVYRGTGKVLMSPVADSSIYKAVGLSADD